jgi:GGDEF domain-containing protein
MERLDISGKNVIDIHSYVYALIAFAILAILISRNHQILSAYFSILIYEAVYVALKLLVFNNRPLLGGIYTYLSITEMTLLAISILLAYDVARALTEVEGVIEKVTFPRHGERVIPINEAVEDVKLEFIRSRRHNRPLSVVVVGIEPHELMSNFEQAVKKIQKAMVTRYILASLANILSMEARRTDLIIDQVEKDRFILLCPETTAEGSNVLSERIQSIANERLGVKVKCGLAAFPDEALTFEDLLQKAQDNLGGQPSVISIPAPLASDEIGKT